jgi:hypothetical protein
MTEQQKDRKWILEREMALELAHADISSYCIRHKIKGVVWFDYSEICVGVQEWEEGALRQVERAIEYIELRELLTRHPTKAKWITFTGAE